MLSALCYDCRLTSNRLTLTCRVSRKENGGRNRDVALLAESATCSGNSVVFLSVCLLNFKEVY